MLEEDERGDFNDEVRPGVEANFALAVAARNALPALIGEVLRLRADRPLIVG